MCVLLMVALFVLAMLRVCGTFLKTVRKRKRSAETDEVVRGIVFMPTRCAAELTELRAASMVPM